MDSVYLVGFVFTLVNELHSTLTDRPVYRRDGETYRFTVTDSVFVSVVLAATWPFYWGSRVLASLRG